MTSSLKDGGVLVLPGGWRRVAAEAIPCALFGTLSAVVLANCVCVLRSGAGFLWTPRSTEGCVYVALSSAFTLLVLAFLLLRLARQLGTDAWRRTFVVSKESLEVWEADGSSRLFCWTDLQSVDPKTGALIFLDGSEVLFRRFTPGVFADFWPTIRERILKVVPEDSMYAKAMREYRGVKPTNSEKALGSLGCITIFPLMWFHARSEAGDGILWLYFVSLLLLVGALGLRRQGRREQVRQKWL